MKKRKIIIISESQARSLISKIISEAKRLRKTPQKAKTHRGGGLI